MRLRWLALLSASLIAAAAQTPPANTLRIYAVDVEGGKATLFVAPSGESLLIDTGNAGSGAHRDADRIMAAVKDAGLERIDHLVITHWHRDHFGGLPALAERITIREFIDHGANQQPDAVADPFLQQIYPALYGKATHRVVQPGDTIPFADLDVRVVASAGDVEHHALPGGGAVNPWCTGASRPPDGKGENPQSIGLRIDFGSFRVVDLGDLSSDKEFDLMCPNNPLGTTDVFMVSHHGQSKSNLPLLVHAIEPRVAIMNNGSQKGGQPEVMTVLHSSPGLETLWQLHRSHEAGVEYNAPGVFVANESRGSHDGPAFWIEVVAQPDGSFIVTNTRNGFYRTYRSRPLLVPTDY
jgi:competence protein ComEC